MHQFDAECAVCQEAQREGVSHDEAMRRALIREAHMIEQTGWVAHVISDAPLAHTHGCNETYGHLDFEVRLPASPIMRYDLLLALVGAVKAGQTFHAGVESPTPFQCPVRFVERQEGDRTVLRAIFPDDKGRFPGDPGCAPGYADQLHED